MNSESGSGLESYADLEDLEEVISHFEEKSIRHIMQVAKILVVLMCILEVFPILGWMILSGVALHLILAGLSGHVVDKV